MDFFERKLPVVVSGRFWFPDEPTAVFSGKVTIALGHLYDFEMELPTQSANTRRFAAQNLLEKYDAIFGEDREAKPISLLNCTSLGSDITHLPPQAIIKQTAKFWAECVVLGAHIANLDAVKITDFHAFFTGFTAWAGGITPEQWIDLGSHQLNRADEIQDFGGIDILCGGRNRARSTDFFERTLLRYLQPHFRPASSLHFREMLEVIRAFQRLQSLLQGGPVGWDYLRANIDSSLTGELSNSVSLVEFFAMLTGFQQRFGERHVHEMVVPLAAVEEKWSEIVARWFKYHEKFEEVLNLYFSVVFGDSLFIEAKFLFLSQALEGYHRIKSGIQKMPLKARLSALFDSHTDIFSRFISDPAEFCHRLRVGRNHLTHPGDERLIKLAKDFDFIALTSRLHAVLHICFLIDLGIQGPAIDRITLYESMRFRT